MPVRLAVVATHPIQYYAPLFRLLAERPRADLQVFYCWEGAARSGAHDPGFARAVRWDVPLLDGYASTFVPNVAADPGTHHFRGLDNPELVDRVLAWGPDVVLVFGWAWKSHLQVLRGFHGRVPVLFRGDSTLLDERPGVRRRMRRGWLRWVYRHVDVALYTGIRNRAYFRAHGLDGDRLRWAPHTVENERFADPDGVHGAEAREWRVRLGIGEGETAFLFAGKLEPKKAPEILLEAFLATDRPGAHLVLVGSGPMEESLKARAEGRPRVHFLGFRNQSRMPAVYRIGDVLVLPSRGPGETWGLAVNEAMASGRPAIVSDRVGCAPDLVADGSVGRVVPAGRVAPLASSMTELAAAPDLRTRMRESAEAAIRPWSLSRQADAVLESAERLS